MSPMFSWGVSCVCVCGGFCDGSGSDSGGGVDVPVVRDEGEVGSPSFQPH